MSSEDTFGAKYRKQIALKTAKREIIPFKIDISPEKLYKWHMKNYSISLLTNKI